MLATFFLGPQPFGPPKMSLVLRPPVAWSAILRTGCRPVLCPIVSCRRLVPSLLWDSSSCTRIGGPVPFSWPWLYLCPSSGIFPSIALQFSLKYSSLSSFSLVQLDLPLNSVGLYCPVDEQAEQCLQAIDVDHISCIHQGHVLPLPLIPSHQKPCVWSDSFQQSSGHSLLCDWGFLGHCHRGAQQMQAAMGYVTFDLK